MKFAHIRVSEYFTFAKQIFHSEAISLARRANFVKKSTCRSKCYFLGAPSGTLNPGVAPAFTSSSACNTQRIFRTRRGFIVLSKGKAKKKTKHKAWFLLCSKTSGTLNPSGAPVFSFLSLGTTRTAHLASEGILRLAPKVKQKRKPSTRLGFLFWCTSGDSNPGPTD